MEINNKRSNHFSKMTQPAFSSSFKPPPAVQEKTDFKIENVQKIFNSLDFDHQKTILLLLEKKIWN